MVDAMWRKYLTVEFVIALGPPLCGMQISFRRPNVVSLACSFERSAAEIAGRARDAGYTPTGQFLCSWCFTSITPFGVYEMSRASFQALVKKTDLLEHLF